MSFPDSLDVVEMIYLNSIYFYFSTKAVVVCATKQVVSGLRYKVQTTKCIMHFVELACVMRSLIPENCEEKARK